MVLGYYSGVRVIASHILHEICLLICELAIRGIKLTLNARLGTKSNLLIEQLLLGEHHCTIQVLHKSISINKANLRAYQLLTKTCHKYIHFTIQTRY